MGLIGGIAGGIGSAVAGIVGGSATRKAAQRNEALLKEQEEANKDWYDKEYNANFLDRSDARASISQAREILNDRYRNAQGMAAVTGSTEESIAQQKAAANDTLAAVTSNIAERADAHKDAVRANYESKQDAIVQQKMGVNNQRAQATAQTAQGIAQGLSQMGNGLDDFFKLGKK